MEEASPDLSGSGRSGRGDCIFCAIVAGSAPASIVYDDADLLAFMDIRPVTSGHLLIIPKRHAPFLADLDEATGARMFTVAMRLAQAMRVSGLRCEGINLFRGSGVPGGLSHPSPRHPAVCRGHISHRRGLVRYAIARRS
jgi:hypothetical protein